MRFAKYQALGNDYVVVDAEEWQGWLNPPAIRRVCDRHFGIGSDGVLVREPRLAGAPERVRIFNSDGSEAEKSGNGLRIFARYLADNTTVELGWFAVRTRGGDVLCRVSEGGRMVTVDMGQVSFESGAVPMTGPSREALRERIVVGGRSLEVCGASIGNPHCVVLAGRASEDDARRLGPLLERHEWFPQRTNVHFLEVVDARNLRLEIWERGSGYTLSSGSCASAAAAVARRLGLASGRVAVHMRGGIAEVEIDDAFRVRLRGAVTKVALGCASLEFLSAVADEA
jgi:diaminopimelate epimerase